MHAACSKERASTRAWEVGTTMKRALVLTLGAALCASASTLAVSAFAAAAPTPKASAGAWKMPRNAFGQPDLGGNWTNVSLTPEMRPAALGMKSAYTPEEVAAQEKAIDKEVAEGNEKSDPNAGAPKKGGEEKAGIRPEFAAAGGGTGGYDRGWLDPGSAIMRVNGEARTSILTTPNGQIPKPKDGVKMPAGFRGGLGSFDNPENRSLGERCIMGFGRNAGPPMLANGFYNNDYQFIQTPKEVAIVVEMVHDVRRIRLNDQHRTDGVRPWMGDSIGWWDGDTLVAETTNFPQAMAYHGSWKNLKVTERFTRVGQNRMHYAFTVEDPTIWDKPWGGEYEFHPLQGQIYEYACHEGNYALHGMLAGARAQEKGPPPAAQGGGN